jgi:hypothetical protein
MIELSLWTVGDGGEYQVMVHASCPAEALWKARMSVNAIRAADPAAVPHPDDLIEAHPTTDTEVCA